MAQSAERFLPFEASLLRNATVVLHGATGAVGGGVLDRLRAAGAKIAVPVRRAWQVDALRARLADADSLVAVVDSRDGEAAAGFAKGVHDSLGPVDAVISTAGAFSTQPLGTERAGTDLELVEANFLSIHNLVRGLVPGLRRRGRGALVFTGAAAVGTASGAQMALYLASKAALHEYARCVATELAPVGVAVAVIAPGTLDTTANREAMPERDPSELVPPERLAEALLGAAASARPEPGDPVYRLAPDGAQQKR